MPMTANQMIYLQMALPPPKQLFDFPTKRVNENNLFGSQVGSVRGHPVYFVFDAEADDKDGVLHAVVCISEVDFAKEKYLAICCDGKPFNLFPPCIFLQSSDEVFPFLYPLVKECMILVAAVQDACLSQVEDTTDKGTFGTLAVSQINFAGDTYIEIKA